MGVGDDRARERRRDDRDGDGGDGAMADVRSDRGIAAGWFARDDAGERARAGAGGRDARVGGGDRDSVWANCMEDETTDKYTRGARTTWVGRHAFDVDERYNPLKIIGRGAYGVVCSAIDGAPMARGRVGTSRRVAVKKLTNCFDSLVEARRALREVHLLRRLRHENVIKLVDVMMPTNEIGRVSDVYLVYELMDTDLHQIIRSDQTLLDEHCQYFMYQILRGLKYVHSANVLHRDLKPSNILLNANCDLCICDFGLARSMVEEGHMMTSYVVTRWYRAPELLLNSEEYAASIDMWSVGCILAEIIARKPLFPGKDFIHQMHLIIETLGSPEEADLEFISSSYARKYIGALPRKPKIDFASLYPRANVLVVDLLERILVFNPHRRISVVEALAHPYLASLHYVSAEPRYAADPSDLHHDPLDDPDVHVPDEHLRDALRNQMLAVKAANW